MFIMNLNKPNSFRGLILTLFIVTLCFSHIYNQVHCLQEEDLSNEETFDDEPPRARQQTVVKQQQVQASQVKTVPTKTITSKGTATPTTGNKVQAPSAKTTNTASETKVTKQQEPPTKAMLEGYSSSVSSLLNIVQDQSFKYFNIDADRCRNRASCDLGAMLYKKLGFVHNWVLRTSVRHMVDPTNVYAQSWVEGMLGRNCTLIYAGCQQSPVDSLMSLALLQRFIS